MERPVLEAEPRTLKGKKVSQLRRKGLIPAVLYGKKVESMPIQLNKRAFDKLFRDAGSNTIITLKLDDTPRNILIHEPGNHPVTGEVEHVDLYQVDMSQKITAEVPVRFNGDAPAVREQDGTLVTNKDSVEVECLPADLPSEFEIDLSPLIDFEAQLKVSDLKVPNDVEIVDEPEEVLAYVEPPRSEEELAALEETPEETELPEVIGEEAVEGEAAEGEAAAGAEASSGEEAPTEESKEEK